MRRHRADGSFVGRRRELLALRRLLRTTRLLTLWGPGGSGKTRLAAELATTSKAGTTAWIDLAPLREPTAVAAAIERALGIVGDGTLTAAGIAAALRGVNTLVVLDSCDRLTATCGQIAGRLLEASGDVQVLATSRVPLGTRDEVIWRVPPLSLPEGSITSAAEALRSDAVRLFVDRANRTGARFTLDGATLPSVLEICRAVDGLPLAIELAAARLRHLGVTDVLRHLESSLDLLVGERVGDPRHRTMRATIDWSHDLLDAAQRRTFRRLAVFAGDFALDAAEAVCRSVGGVDDVVATVTDLVDRSLVGYVGSTGRYRLLEPVREYAEERLRESGEEDRAAAACTRYFVRLATVELAPGGRVDADARMRAEFGNVAALLPSLVRTDAPRALELLLRFASFRWTAVPVHLSVLSYWLSRALEAHPARDSLRARALLDRAALDREVADDAARTASARAAVDEALTIALEIDDESLEIAARHSSANCAVNEGPPERAIRLYEDVVPWLKPRALAMALSVRSVLKQQIGDATGAQVDLDDAFAAWERHGDQQFGERFLTHLCAADIAFRAGANSRAIASLRDAIRIRMASGEQPSPAPFELLAHLAATSGDHVRALRLAGFADRLRAETGLWPAMFLALADRSWLAESERAVGRPAMAVRTSGRRMSAADAISYALDDRRSRVLTDRELAVARLVAQGLTDREIGTALSISERTAENHVQHIRDKLALRSRGQIGSWTATYELAEAGV